MNSRLREDADQLFEVSMEKGQSMDNIITKNSRLREDADRLFEVFTEVGRSTEDGQEPFVLQQFPADYNDEDVLRSLTKFVFPCKAESLAVDHFTFVLTDIDGKFKFGFCRHSAGGQTCLCILSCYPWFEIYYKLLNYLAELLNSSDVTTVEPLLLLLYDHKPPAPREQVQVSTRSLEQKSSTQCPEPIEMPKIPENKFSFQCPDPRELPKIPENRNLTEYYNAVDATSMMVIFASMLNERRILVISKKLSRLTSCIHAAAALIYPLHWQHLYIPVLPQQLIEYCSAPMPYLIGLHSSLYQDLQGLDDAVVLDADANTVTSEYDDLASLPSDVVSTLKKRLRAQQSDKMNSEAVGGQGVARSFIKALVSLIGGYRDGLRFKPNEPITFDPDAFLRSRPSSMRPFLENILDLQTFTQFINDRLDMLNNGIGFTDEFEQEVNVLADKWSTQSRYQEWSTNVKKHGKKLKREGKDKWTEITNRVRDKSKKKFKELKIKVGELRKQEEEEVGLNRTRPGTTSSLPKPPRPSPPDLSKALGPTVPPRQSILRRTSYEKTRQYKLISAADSMANHDLSRSSKRMSTDDSEVIDLSMKRVSTDLLADPDIQQLMKKSYSLENIIGTVDEERAGWEKLVDSDEEEDDLKDMLDVTYDGCTKHRTSSLSSTPPPRPLQPMIGRSLAQQPMSSLTPKDSQPMKTSGLHNLGSSVSLDSTPRPTPAPRTKKLAKQTEGIIMRGPTAHVDPTKRHTVYGNVTSNLSSPRSNGNVTKSDNMNKTMTSQSNSGTSLSSLEFDPLMQEAESSPSSGLDSVSRSRSSVSRTNAFCKGSKSQPVRRDSPTHTPSDAPTIKEARTAFMITDSPGNSIQGSTIKDFDPLLTGQLVLENPADKFPTNVKQEENLLKEWNLHFDKRGTLPLHRPNMARLSYAGSGASPSAYSGALLPGTAETGSRNMYQSSQFPGPAFSPQTPAFVSPGLARIMNQLPGDGQKSAQNVRPVPDVPVSDLLDLGASHQGAGGMVSAQFGSGTAVVGSSNTSNVQRAWEQFE